MGRPVDAVTVEIEVPDRVARDIKQAESGSGGGGGYGGVLDSVRVDVAGQRVWVSAPGCQELEVALPLAVSAQVRRSSHTHTRTNMHMVCVVWVFMSSFSWSLRLLKLVYDADA